MAVDRILAFVAVGFFAAFLGIVAFKVQRADLFIVCAIGVAMAGYDFWRSLSRGTR